MPTNVGVGSILIEEWPPMTQLLGWTGEFDSGNGSLVKVLEQRQKIESRITFAQQNLVVTRMTSTTPGNISSRSALAVRSLHCPR